MGWRMDAKKPEVHSGFFIKEGEGGPLSSGYLMIMFLMIVTVAVTAFDTFPAASFAHA